MVLQMESRERPKGYYTCSYVPVELIHASGASPARLIPDQRVPGIGDRYFPATFCPYVKGVLEAGRLVMGTGRAAGNSDLIVIACSCDPMRRLFDAWCHEYPGIPALMLDVPRNFSQASADYFAGELRKLYRMLCEELGATPSVSKVALSIRAYNTMRRSAREQIPLMLESGSAVMAWRTWKHMAETPEEVDNLGAQYMNDDTPRLQDAAGSSQDREGRICSACRRMAHPYEGLTDSLSRRDGTGVMGSGNESDFVYLGEASKGSEAGPRLLVSSILLDESVLRSIEESGAHTVALDSCSFWRSADLVVDESIDPFYALAIAYLNKPPCPRVQDWAKRSAYLLELVQQANAQGVIYCIPKFCDISLYEVPLAKKTFSSMGLPLLFTETDYGSGEHGQFKTRIKGFVESLILKRGGLG